MMPAQSCRRRRASGIALERAERRCRLVEIRGDRVQSFVHAFVRGQMQSSHGDCPIAGSYFETGYWLSMVSSAKAADDAVPITRFYDCSDDDG
jgi:hypothetical protein